MLGSPIFGISHVGLDGLGIGLWGFVHIEFSAGEQKSIESQTLHHSRSCSPETSWHAVQPQRLTRSVVCHRSTLTHTVVAHY